MQPRSKSAIWSNDDSLPQSAKAASRKPGGQSGLAKSAKTSDTDEEDDADFQDLTKAEARDSDSSDLGKANFEGKDAVSPPQSGA